MKTNQNSRFIAPVSLAIAIAAFLATVTSSLAAEQLKGGQIQIGQRPAQLQPLTAADLTPASGPECPACTNNTKPFATAAGRGAFVKTGVTITHQCPTCKTSFVTVGTGKAKVQQTVHTCGNGQVADCCAGMAGM